MAVTRELAHRDMNYLDRNKGWNLVASAPPPINVLLETKIDTLEDGARNIGTILEYGVPFGSGWSFEDGRLVDYTPTHWRHRQVAHKCQGGDWDFVKAMNAIGPGFASGDPPRADEPIAVFGTADYAPNFEVQLCTAETLGRTVYNMIFSGDDFDTEAARRSCRMAAAQDAMLEMVRDGSESAYGLSVVTGLQSIVAELMKRAKDIAEDRDAQDKQRADAIAALDRSEANYYSLAGSILAAIAPGTAIDIMAEVRNAARRRP